MSRCDYNGPYKRDSEGISGESYVRMEARTAVMHFDDGEREHDPESTGGRQNLKMVPRGHLPSRPQKEPALPTSSL